MTPEPEYRIALSAISCTILSLFERFISLACRKKFPITLEIKLVASPNILCSNTLLCSNYTGGQ